MRLRVLLIPLPAVLVCISIAAHATERPQHNPFAPLAGQKNDENAKPPTKSMQLRGIMSSSSGGIANIGGNIVTTGDEYRGYTVETIGERSVTLKRGDSEITLTLTE